MLIAAGGRELVEQTDRWGRSALDEAKKLGVRQLVEAMEGAEPASVKGHALSSHGSSGSNNSSSSGSSSSSQGSNIDGLHGSGHSGDSARGSSPVA